MSKSKRYLFHSSYFYLAFGLSAFTFLYFYFSAKPNFQAITVILMGIYYVIWGTIHHINQKDFHFKILLEYVLISAIAVLMLLTLIFRL